MKSFENGISVESVMWIGMSINDQNRKNTSEWKT